MPWDCRWVSWDAVGLPWDCHRLIALPWGCHWIATRLSWLHVTAMGLPWDCHESDMELPWGFRRTVIEPPRDCHEM